MNARDTILARLKAAAPGSQPDLPAFPDEAHDDEPQARRVARFADALAAAHAEVHRTTADGWPALLARILAAKRAGRLLLDRAAPADRIEPVLAGGIEVHVFDRAIEEWKQALFDDMDAGFCVADAGIAATGTLVFSTDARRPRSVSLVPPLHVALIDANAIHADLRAAAVAGAWADDMPSNLVLVSGPSKTSDIQQTLAFGAHGPRELVVLIVQYEAVAEPDEAAAVPAPAPQTAAVRAPHAATQALHFVPPGNFRERSAAALADPKLRASFRGAMEFLQAKRRAQFPDAAEREALRDTGEAIRRNALGRLPTLLATLEERLTALGVEVCWARDADEACTLIHAIAQRHGATKVIKGKSMASEEIELNHYLAQRGIESLESDMGEYIVQLAGEKPSHIVMPAIHKTRQDIGELFEKHIPQTPYTDDVDSLIRIGRRALRQRFGDADIGISGVNFAVAETGTLCLVENEGNGRLATTVPPVHIAIMGIEKVVEKFEHVIPLYSLLTRSATGQAITTYFNLITGARRAGELDGPRHLHLVLLDNGRTQAYADEQLRATLQCIRCGACMNHCPVYERIGGHAYGTVYPGPIGAILSPHLLGLESTHELTTASSLCGACAEVCPVRIPIPDLLIRLRAEAKRAPDETAPLPLRGQGASYSAGERLVWRFWSGTFAEPRRYRAFSWAATRLRALTPSKQMGWTQHRTPLVPAARSLHAMLKEKGQPE